MNRSRLMTIGLGLFFAIGGLIWAGINISFASSAHSTEGKVIGLSETRDHDGSSYRPVVAYQVDGKTYEFTSSTGSNPASYSIGEKVQVLYAPAEPGKGRLDSLSENWLAPLIFLVIGGGLTIAGILGIEIKHSNQSSSDW